MWREPDAPSSVAVVTLGLLPDQLHHGARLHHQPNGVGSGDVRAINVGARPAPCQIAARAAYSARSDSTGLTWVARQAGMTDAATPAPSKAAPATQRLTGSAGEIP